MQQKRTENKFLPKNLEELLLMHLAETKISQAINLLQIFTLTFTTFFGGRGDSFCRVNSQIPYRPQMLCTF